MRYCNRKSIAHTICGKLVVAATADQLPALERLADRAAQNGLGEVRRVSGGEIPEYEPAIRGKAALWVPQTGVVDYRKVAESYAADIRAAGGEILAGHRLHGVKQPANEPLTLETSQGEIRTRLLVNAAGLYSDRVARLCGVDPKARIIPFRGEYYELKDSAARRIRGLVYPVPDARLPFLGVHFTRRIDGQVECGPNAVLAWRREGYRKGDFSLRDAAESAAYPGLMRLAMRHWRYGLGELHRSYSKKAFAAALRIYYPELDDDDLAPAGSGVRAQAVLRDGSLVDDFLIRKGTRSLHILNAPSPAATASLAIGETVAAMALDALR